MGILDGIEDWLATQVKNFLDLASTSVLGALGCNIHHGLRYAVLPGRHLESVTTPLLSKGGDGLWAF